MKRDCMKRKIMTLADAGIPRFECVRDFKKDQYLVYELRYDGGWHRKQVAKCDRLEAVLAFVFDMVRIYHLN